MAALFESGRGYPFQVYGDDELGPLLKADRYAGLRAKYPPPTNP